MIAGRLGMILRALCVPAIPPSVRLSPLISALAKKTSVSGLTSTLTSKQHLKLFRINTYKKVGGGTPPIQVDARPATTSSEEVSSFPPSRDEARVPDLAAPQAPIFPVLSSLVPAHSPKVSPPCPRAPSTPTPPPI